MAIAAPRLMRIPEVSVLTGIPEATLRYMRHERRGPKSALLAGRVVYRESDVLDWINEQFENAAVAQ